jgi:hypothetical protein
MALSPDQLLQMANDYTLNSVCSPLCDMPASEDKWDRVLDMVKAGFLSVDAAISYNRWSLIHFAADQCNVRVICALKELGADMNTTTKLGSTPMHCCVCTDFGALHKDRMSACGLLSIDNLVCRDEYLLTPLDYATLFDKVDMARWMMEQPTCTAEMKARARAHIPTKWGKQSQAMTAVFEEDRRWSSLRSGWLAAVVAAPLTPRR